MQKLKTLTLLAIATCLLLEDLCAKDLGVFGTLFPIEENNLLEVIQTRLARLQQEGTLEKHQQNIQHKVKKRIERPQAVEGIIHTVQPRTYTFDPSIIVTKDLKDHQGTVFYQKGQRVNPLETRALTKPLLFIDGDESTHLTWAFFMLKRHPLAKVILVKGAPLQMMKDLGIQVFFDQLGKITHKLGIKQVPAIVTQEGMLLKVEEQKADTATLVETRHQKTQPLNAKTKG
jgi:conjugal transfer pilus assembly protein TraW